MKASGYEVNALVGVSILAKPPGHQYEPKSPRPFGEDVPLTIARKAGTTRKRLERALTNHLNTGII